MHLQFECIITRTLDKPIYENRILIIDLDCKHWMIWFGNTMSAYDQGKDETQESDNAQGIPVS